MGSPATKEVKFANDRHSMEQIQKVIERARRLANQHNLKHGDQQTMEMDLSAAHYSCPLDFPKLLAFDDKNFAHDVFGIFRHIDRRTGQLGDCFLPRCHLKEKPDARAKTA